MPLAVLAAALFSIAPARPPLVADELTSCGAGCGKCAGVFCNDVVDGCCQAGCGVFGDLLEGFTSTACGTSRREPGAPAPDDGDGDDGDDDEDGPQDVRAPGAQRY